MKTNLIQTCLLAAALLALPAMVQAQFTYTTNNGTITITGYTGSGGALTIPATIAGLPVIGIGDYAFYDNYFMTSVTIGSGVANIGDFAFEDCSSLTNITVDAANLVYAGVNGVLLNKNQTTLILYPGGNAASSYTVPDGVTNIGNYAFSYCLNLASVSIPDSVINIGEGAFAGCYGLAQVTVGKRVTNIGDYAFRFCDSLKSVFFTGSAPDFGVSVFFWIRPDGGGLEKFSDPVTFYYLSGTAGWENFSAAMGFPTIMLNASAQFGAMDNGLEYIGDDSEVIVTGYASSNNAVIIPSNIGGVPVTSIGDYAFKGSVLTNVTIGSSVTIIGASAFDYCLSLTSVYFNGNAPNAGPSVFYDDINGYDPATVYYLPNTTGWSNTFAGLPTAVWLPQVQNGDAAFGVRTNQFGFNIAWASGQTVVVEACTNLSNPVWLPVSTNTLVGGTSYFSDPQPAKLSSRFYRLRSS